jgi:hypothetical protein
MNNDLNNNRNNESEISEKRLSSLSTTERLEADINGLARRCISERILPEDLQVTETGQERKVLVRRVEEKNIALLHEKLKDSPMYNLQEDQDSADEITLQPKNVQFEGPEKRATDLPAEERIIADINGLTSRCIRENTVPENLEMTETGHYREILITRIKKQIMKLLLEQFSG